MFSICIAPAESRYIVLMFIDDVDGDKKNTSPYPHNHHLAGISCKLKNGDYGDNVSIFLSLILLMMMILMLVDDVDE